MDFAPEPVLDAFATPPTQAAPRTPVADDNGQTFDDHLGAVREPAHERPAAARGEVRDETPAQGDTKPAGPDQIEAANETADPNVALHGGPAPQAPPPLAAPVVIQIAASQPGQLQDQAQPQNGAANAEPITAAPQATASVAPAAETKTASAPQTAPSAPIAGKNAQAEVKPAPPDASRTQAPQGQNAQPAQSAQPRPESSATTPIALQEAPPAVQQAIAATIAPAPEPVTQAAQSAVRPSMQAQAVEAPATPRDGKPSAATANANAKAPAGKAAASNGPIMIDTAAPAAQPQSSASEASQIQQSNAATTTASNASTHVQHAAVESSAQRAAPAAAQVAREIIRRFDGGSTSFELRLDPPELGRVEVRMEVSRDHRVTAVIAADSPQALTELARHARELEAQLQSAGLQLSDNGLSFDLRQGAGRGEAQEANASQGNGGGDETLTEQQAAPVARPIGLERWRGVRVDMMV
jgi:flagellar hook-length control protein FliK